jgi:hypothetical protein
MEMEGLSNLLCLIIILSVSKKVEKGILKERKTPLRSN